MMFCGKRLFLCVLFCLCFVDPIFSAVKRKQPLTKIRPNSSVLESADRPEFTDETTIFQLYQMMKDVHEVLTTNKIEYWAIAGTLLGAVRHQGIIPWDDDLDICINENLRKKFLTLSPVLNRLGYDILVKKIGCKVRPKDKKYPVLDVFFYTQTVNGIFYGWYNYFKFPRTDKDVVIYADELFPLRDYKFGNFWIKGPNDPVKYLECCYGPEVWEYTYHGKSHKKIGVIKKLKLKDSDKVPARLNAPLKNNLFNRLFDLQISIETLQISKNNLEESKKVMQSVFPVFVEAFKDQAESQMKEEHFGEYQALVKSGLTINDILAARFEKIIEVVISQLDLVEASYVTVLKNSQNVPIGYAIFVHAPIENIIQSMVDRCYIKKNVNLSSDIYIVSIAVSPIYQGIGQGKRLIVSMVPEHPRTSDIYLLTAESKTNLATQKFYEHMGFERAEIFLTLDDNLKILYRLPK